MTNCLVTRLKSAVDNQNLIALGELRFEVKVKAGAQAPFFLESASPMTCIIRGEGHFYKGTVDSQTDITSIIENVTTTGGYRVSPGESVISIIPKYNLTNITLSVYGSSTYDYIKANMDDLQFNETGLSKIQIVGSINQVFDAPLNFDKIKLTNLTDLKVSSIAKGDIVNVAKAISSPTGSGNITVGGAGVVNDTTGTIESFVRNIKSSAYGSVGMIVYKGKWTLHDIVLDYAVTINTDASGDATIQKTTDSTTLATYNRQSDTFTYN